MLPRLLIFFNLRSFYFLVIYENDFFNLFFELVITGVKNSQTLELLPALVELWHYLMQNGYLKDFFNLHTFLLKNLI